MPIYEYKCDNCGDVFELRQKFSDEPLTTHEKCGGPVHRLISAPALQFKGSGWYITDYARAGGSSKESKFQESKSPESKSETKSESKSNGSSSTESKSSSSDTSTKSDSK